MDVDIELLLPAARHRESLRFALRRRAIMHNMQQGGHGAIVTKHRSYRKRTFEG